MCGPERGGGSWGVGQGRARKRDAHAEEPRLGAGHAPADLEHAVHERDVGRVKVHRLVETFRSLTSRRERVREKVCRPQGAGELGGVVGQWRRQERRAHAEDPRLEGLGQGTRGERT